VNKIAPKERDIAMVFQNYALYPHMTVFENMAFSLKLAGCSKKEQRERVDEATRILGLGEYLERYPRQLSGGQRQRVAMGRAIVRKPRVFLFDEPLSNLDANLRVQMRTEIRELHRRLKTTSVYVTHDQIEAMTMADKIVVMNKGNVEQVGSPLDLYDHPANQFVAGFIGSPAMNFLKGVLVTIPAGRAVEFATDRILPAPASAEPDGREVILGVRPEHLLINTSPSNKSRSDDATASQSSADFKSGVEAEVVVIEPTGADTQIFCKLAGNDVVAVTRERHSFRPGDRIRLNVQDGKTCLFDPVSGGRL